METPLPPLQPGALPNSSVITARYVMPRFQGSLVGIEASYNRSVAHSQDLFAARTAALERAHRTFEEKEEQASTPV